MWRRILTIIKKEFLELRRDRASLFMAIGIPLIQLVLYGYVMNFDVKNIPVAVLDFDRSAESRQFIGNFSQSGYFVIKEYIDDGRALRRSMDEGRAKMVIQIPRGFAKDLSKGRTAAVQIIVDGSDSNYATIALNYASNIVRKNSIDIILKRVKSSPQLRKAGTPGTIDNRVRIWYNPALKSVNYMVPGVICMVLLVNCGVLMAISFVRERETRTLEMLIVTPIRGLELILGKIIPYLLIGFCDLVLVTAVAVLWFNVPIRGNFLLLLILSTIFLTSALGIGLLISMISRNQYQAMLISVFIQMPFILLGGFIFPISNMPGIIQYFTHLIPMRYYLTIVRSIFLKGAGMGHLWGEVWPLFILGAVTLSLSIFWFRKRME